MLRLQKRSSGVGRRTGPRLVRLISTGESVGGLRFEEVPSRQYNLTLISLGGASVKRG